MKKDSHITEVIYKVFPKGDAIALFPGIVEGDGLVSSYMHIGQHGVASVDLAKELADATKDQYSELHQELKNLGYNLKII